MQEVILKTDDNVKIAVNGYFSSKNEVVIVAPGWCMTKDSDAFRQISEMFASDYDVLTIDFRGHGKSKGFFTFTSKELLDLDSVVKFAKDKGYSKIYLAGFSLGGGLVLVYAAQNNSIDKLIAVSPYTDFKKIENHMWRKEAWGETFRKFELMRFMSIRPDIIPRKKIKPVDIIKEVKSPTLFVAGEKDPTVFPWHTKELYNKAECEKQFKLYENGIHAEDLFLYFKEDFSKMCINWLKK